MKLLLHPPFPFGGGLPSDDSIARGSAPELFLLLAEPHFRRPRPAGPPFGQPDEKRQSVVRNPGWYRSGPLPPKIPLSIDDQGSKPILGITGERSGLE